MDQNSDLTGREFIGKILPDLDSKQQGRYRVHIPELMQHISDDKGIWCKNSVHTWRITESDDGEYGSYFPLHSGTKVIIKFRYNDTNTGYIDRIISDAEDRTDKEAQDCKTVKPTLTDRDEQYIIFKTPKKFNIFYINEETEKEPNSIYLVYNRDTESSGKKRRTVYRIDESGIHIWTRDNKRVRVLLDQNEQIDGNKSLLVKQNRKANIKLNDDLAVGENRTINVIKDEDKIVYNNRTENIHGKHDLTTKGNRTQNVHGSEDLQVKQNLTIEVFGSTNITVKGTCNIFSETSVNIDAPSVNINGGGASSVPSKIAEIAKDSQPKTEVIDLGPGETSEYDSGIAVGNKCDSSTKPDGGYGV